LKNYITSGIDHLKWGLNFVSGRAAAARGSRNSREPPRALWSSRALGAWRSWFAVFAWVALVTVATIFACIAFGAYVSLVPFGAWRALNTLSATRALQIPLHELLTG
jgi:hypothetical protein